MDEKTSIEFDRLDSELSEAIADLNFTLPNMRTIGRELMRTVGRDKAALVTRKFLAEKPYVQEFVKAAGPGVIDELTQFVIGVTDTLDLESLARRARQDD
jgi:hypothetical protein